LSFGPHSLGNDSVYDHIGIMDDVGGYHYATGMLDPGQTVDLGQFFTFGPSKTIKKIRDWWYGSRLSHEAQAQFSEIVTIIDHPVDEDITADDVHNRTRKRSAFITSIVAETVNSIPGIQVDSVANRMVAKHKLNALCVARGVRPSHTRHILPIAVELVFTPTWSDIEAAQFRNSRAVLDRIRDRDATWYTKERGWLFNWFGERRSRTSPTTA